MSQLYLVLLILFLARLIDDVKKNIKRTTESFEFNSENLVEAKKILAKYPDGKQQSAVMALLYIAQKQHDNWIPLSAMKYIGKFRNAIRKSLRSGNFLYYV